MRSLPQLWRDCGPLIPVNYKVAPINRARRLRPNRNVTGSEVSRVDHHPQDGQILSSFTLGMAAKDYHQPSPITDPGGLCQPPAQASGVQSCSWGQVLKTSLWLPTVPAALAWVLIRKIPPRSLRVCLRSSGDCGLGWQCIYIMIPGLRLVKF